MYLWISVKLSSIFKFRQSYIIREVYIMANNADPNQATPSPGVIKTKCKCQLP